ncbi:hypothetical protein D3C71_1608750 [compost metagenome]
MPCPNTTILRALCCSANAIAASIRAKMRSASALDCSSVVSVTALSATSASPPATCSIGAAVVESLLPVSAGLGAGAASTIRGAMASLCRSGKVILRLLHSASGNLRRKGPIACGQSTVSPAPGMIITAPLGSAVLAGFHKARKVSEPACSCCCS